MEQVAAVTLGANIRDDDAFFVVNSAEVRYLHEQAPGTFDRVTLLPLSLNAFGAALAAGHRKTFDYRPLVDFAACAQDYRKILPRRSRRWLAEMGLGFKVDGIDLAELDAPAQFLFFLHAQQIERLVERLVAEHPHVRHFYVISSDPPAPLDFYFDSDVSAAVVRYVCERLRRPVTIISASPKPRYMPAPIPNEVGIESVPPHLFETKVRLRVGVVTATLRNLEMFFSAFDNLDFDTVLFGSRMWGTSEWDPFSATRLGAPIFFPVEQDDSDVGVIERLDALRASISNRMASGTLPKCIRDNRYLDFQFDHIVKRRWLGYARLIREAARFVERCPLDLLIRSDHFTAEGAVLSQLYKRTGTKVMTAPHSSWPVDINWRSPRHADFALAWSKSSAARLAEVDRRARIYTMGEPLQSGFFQRLYPSTVGNDKLSVVRQSVAGKKVVLLTTNALEVHAVPITDPVAYFDACALVGAVPEKLRNRVIVLTRPKPGHFSEDLMLYERLSGFPASSSVNLASLDFDECLQIADCVVGVNVPTSGYWDVLRRQIPLIYVQTSPAMALHPDMPQSVIGCDFGVERIWDALEAALFDDAYRRKLIDRQTAFVEQEHKTSPSAETHPLYDFLRTVGRPTALSRLAALPARWLAGLRRPSEIPASVAEPAVLDMHELTLAQTWAAGHVDEVKISRDGKTIAVGGWAAALELGQPAVRVHAFVDGIYCGSGETGIDRQDLVEVFNDPNIRKSGYRMRFIAGSQFDLSKLTVYGELSDGTFFVVTPPKLSED